MTARPEGADLVPVALARLASLGWRLLAVLAFAIAVAYLTVILSTVVASVLVAVVISATFSPYLITMRERGRSRTASAALVTVGALAVILGIVLLVALAFLPYLVDLGKAVVGGLSSISDFLGTLPLPADIKAFLAAIGTAITQDITAIASSIASTAATLVTIGILGGILTFFLLQDGDRAWVWALGSWSSWRQEAITSSGRVALDRVGGYLRRSGVQSGISAISGFVFLALLGVPFPGPLAVFVFFGGFIPYFGGIITTTVLALVALGTVGTAKTVLLLVLIVGVNLVQRRWVEPRIRGEALDIHPALLLVVLPLGYALGGLVGLFISVPVLAFVLAVGGALVTVLDDEPGGEPERAEVIPVWLDRLAQWSWRLLVAIGLLAVLVIALVRIPIVVVPVGAAIIAAATLHPADVALRKRGLSPGRSALVATLGAAVAITAILFLTVYSLAGPIQQLIDSAVSGAESSDGAADGMLGMLVDFVRSVGQGLVPAVLDIARAVVGLAFVVIISGLLTFFFIRDGSTLWGRLTRPLAAHRRRHLDAAGDASVRVLGGYMIATGVISAFRCRDPVRHHGHPGHPAGIAARDPVVLRRVHPVRRHRS